MRFVLDCSMTMSWCFEDEADAAADAVLDCLIDSEARVASIWPLEVANVLLVAERRGRLRAADSARFLQLLGGLPVTVEETDRPRAHGSVLELGVTYIAVERATILGFITVSPASLDADDVPFGRKLPPFPLPVLRIARFAQDERARGLGIGRALLRFGLELAEVMRDQYGCVGVVVDVKPDAVDFYARYGFTEIQALEGASRAKPRPTPMFLALGSVPSRLEVEP